MLATRLLERAETRTLPIAEARDHWRQYRVANGYADIAPPALLTPPDANTKFAKSTDAMVYGLSLSPHRTSGHNVCAFSTPNCRAGCVAFSGYANFTGAAAARIVKTNFLMDDPSAFVTLLQNEIERLHKRFPKTLVVRLNTFSDLPWETLFPQVFIPGVRYFDYAKDWSRVSTPNYWLTYSASEKTTDEQIIAKVAEGCNVSVVFSTRKTRYLPVGYLGIPVIDGDKSDIRDRDPKGVIVGLRAKGLMRKNPGKMVRQAPEGARISQ